MGVAGDGWLVAGLRGISESHKITEVFRQMFSEHSLKQKNVWKRLRFRATEGETLHVNRDFFFF